MNVIQLHRQPTVADRRRVLASQIRSLRERVLELTRREHDVGHCEQASDRAAEDAFAAKVHLSNALNTYFDLSEEETERR